MNGKRVTCQELPNMIESVKEIAETSSKPSKPSKPSKMSKPSKPSCYELLFSGVCCHLLLFASQHEPKMVQKACQASRNGPRGPPRSPKMAPWGLKKTSRERQNSFPRRPGDP